PISGFGCIGPVWDWRSVSVQNGIKKSESNTMSDAKRVSQLISMSLRYRLSEAEAAEVDQHLSSDEQSRRFAELSKLIQSSVTHGANLVETDTTAGSGLSTEARQRMEESVAHAASEKENLSASGLIRANTSTRMVEGSRAPGGADAEQRGMVSNFSLTRSLGEGGLGRVWLARDERLKRTVAVKELRQEGLESAKAWSRFQREAEITGRLEHPNIISLYQYGADRQTGEPFYVMRFVGKRTLADAIVEYHDRLSVGQDCGLGLHRLLNVFLDVCQAIAYAHSRGVVHRDLKPENVALNNFGEVVVLDWGLAKLLDDGELAVKVTCEAKLSDSALQHTMEGDAIGTPLYMAPEQAAGRLDDVNQRTDIYGLGALLFAILSGKAPHEQTAIVKKEAGLSGVLKMIAEGDTPWVSSVREVPRGLETICHKAMASKQHLRYETVEELAEAIERWMAGQSEKQARYESLRMEGRELRADLQAGVDGLERNVRFMSHLPPIQEPIRATEADEIAGWRERLSTIFKGLLEANPDYYDYVIYSRLEGNQFTELVRVERLRKDGSSVRVVPRSRLRSGEASEYLLALAEEMPEEVRTSLVCDPTCDKAVGCQELVGLVSGIPIYDERTEEPFGFVMIGADINKALNRQLSQASSATEVIAACDIFNVMMHSKDGQIQATEGRPVAEVAEQFLPAVDHLQSNLEYIDEANGDIYGARIWFIPNKHGLMYLLKRT
ncbi:MAG: serine/threonine-protein kinase, partial [Planctomycetota bacterium]